MNFRIALISLSSVAFLAGCIYENNPESGENQAAGYASLSAIRLEPASNCDAYKAYISDGVIQAYLGRLSWQMLNRDAVLFQQEAAATDGPSAAATHPDAVSQTTTQETAVDEADIVKVDSAGRLYILEMGYLNIVQGFPPREMQHLAKLYLGGNLQEMYLDEQAGRLVILGYQWDRAMLPATLAEPSIVIGATEITFIDISDPSNPVVTSRKYLEGYRITSRRVANRIHLVSRYTITAPPVIQNNPQLTELSSSYWQAMQTEQTTEYSDGLRQQIEQKIRRLMLGVEAKELMPKIISKRGDAVTDVTSALSCDQILIPEVKMPPSLLLITSFDTDGSHLDSSAIMNNAWMTYASQDHLYIAQSSQGWWWADDQPNQSAIYKFEISDQKPKYIATGSVIGWIKDRYSFSEYDGFLRIVTTDNWFDQTAGRMKTAHHLSVLTDNNNGMLEVIGSVSGFGQDESVFAVRLLKQRGYVVTFRQIDPLFSFDLSDPYKPVLVGELEIPGFSTYMHPIDDNHLLTIGRSGNMTDLQLQLFDVSDLANPRLVHRFSPEIVASGYSWSPASYDPHAFTFFKPLGYLAIPLLISDWETGTYYSGIVNFRVDIQEGISELGRVNHADLAYQVMCSGISDIDSSWPYLCARGGYTYQAIPRRAVFMTSNDHNFLFSVSSLGIKSSIAESPETTLSTVVLPQSPAN